MTPVVAIGFSRLDDEYVVSVDADEVVTSHGVDALGLLERSQATGIGG
ncbi:MAG: hypothetical protein WKF82_11535 [Nocardioidaceae bacterium]